MPVRAIGRRYQVTVERASAHDGFRRIRKHVGTLEEGKALEQEISTALETYGHWPVRPAAVPLTVAATPDTEATTALYRNPTHRTGTLREAMKLALQTHWDGMRYARSAEYMLYPMVYFFESIGKPDIDGLRSADIDAYVAQCRAKDQSASYINQQLGALRVVNKVALKRLPPLASISVPLPHLKQGYQEKWWLRPEMHEEVVTTLRQPGRDPLFADLIDVICYEGLRVEEALRLEARQFTGLETPKPWLQPDGTKTSESQNAIPVYPEALPVVLRAIARAKANRWGKLFPINAREAAARWNLVRRDILHVEHIPTATMKSLRRTFAWYATNRGMPTATLQKVLRHKDIKTTSGYLALMGSGELDRSRDYFEAPAEIVVPEPKADMGSIIKAYVATGASPEDVARFAKELMG